MNPNQTVLLSDARARILQDPSLEGIDKFKALQALQAAAEQTPSQAPILTIGDVVRGAVGAGIGYVGASMLGHFIGASDSTISALRVAGMGLGTMLNTGMLKSAEEQDQRNAFRLGFVEACRDMGLFGDPNGPYAKVAAMVPIAVPLTPDTVLAPLRAGYHLFSQGTGTVGAGAAALDAPDSTDEEITKMELERNELEQQAARLKARKGNELIKKILARRA